MRIRGWGAVVAVAVLAALPAHASAASHPANVNWPSYLPAMPGSSATQPGSVPYCRRASVRCVDVQIQRMRRLQKSLRCDHRGVFATTYLELTRQYRRDLATGMKKRLQDVRYLYREVALFANVYFETFKRYRRGQSVPGAWRIAFDTARDGEVNAAQDMLLGINAHVQNDMPFVIASLGLRTKGGESRKVDHDLVNEVLDRAYGRVVAAVTDRYDPFMNTTNAPWSPADDVAGLEMVKGWRERVWRNAERLSNAGSDAERQAVVDDIESQAAEWARGMAAVQTPGDRARRDAYCAERLGR